MGRGRRDKVLLSIEQRRLEIYHTPLHQINCVSPVECVCGNIEPL